MTTLLQNAKSELRSAGLFDDDSDYDGDLGVQVTALMETFCAYGHSGGSAERTIELFSRLAVHKPISPLTGEDSEWEDKGHVGGTPLWQNIRAPNVFKDKRQAWIVLDKSNAEGAFLGDGKINYITFPYTVE